MTDATTSKQKMNVFVKSETLNRTSQNMWAIPKESKTCLLSWSAAAAINYEYLAPYTLCRNVRYCARSEEYCYRKATVEPIQFLSRNYLSRNANYNLCEQVDRALNTSSISTGLMRFQRFCTKHTDPRRSCFSL